MLGKAGEENLEVPPTDPDYLGSMKRPTSRSDGHIYHLSREYTTSDRRPSIDRLSRYFIHTAQAVGWHPLMKKLEQWVE